MSKFIKKLKRTLNERSEYFSEYEIEIPFINSNDEKDVVSYYVDFTINTYVDHNYGADADGNRGVTREEIDKVTIDAVHDENGKLITKDHPMYAKIENKVSEKADELI